MGASTVIEKVTCLQTLKSLLKHQRAVLMLHGLDPFMTVFVGEIRILSPSSNKTWIAELLADSGYEIVPAYRKPENKIGGLYSTAEATVIQ